MSKSTDEQRAEGRWFFALSEPGRVAILRALAGGCHTSQELGAAAGLKALGVGSHLDKLERAGLITSSRDGRDGRERRCKLASARVTKAAIEFTSPNGLRATVPRG